MSDLQFRVLHALALRGTADGPGIADITGHEERVVAGVIEELLAAESIRERRGRRGGYALTAEGKQLHNSRLAELVAPAASEAAGRIYDRFLPLNGEFKRLCTQWQMRGPTLNDHADPDYDAAVIGRLGDVHRQLLPYLSEVADQVPLFDRYPGRLDDRLRRIREGDHASFLKPMTGSYHDVWMELHADLLLAAGRTRSGQDE